MPIVIRSMAKIHGSCGQSPQAFPRHDHGVDRLAAPMVDGAFKRCGLERFPRSRHRSRLRAGGVQVGRVFPWQDRRLASLAIEPLCRATGVAFTPHQARHSFATWLGAEGASVKEIMEAGAWLDYRSVLRYAKVDLPRVRATMNRIKIGA